MDNSRSCSKISIALSVIPLVIYAVLWHRNTSADVGLLIFCLILNAASVILAIIAIITKEKRKKLGLFAMIPNAICIVLFIKTLVEIASA